MDNITSQQDIAKAQDKHDRDLFCKTMNEFLQNRVTTSTYRITFCDVVAEQDVLVINKDDLFWIINTHANSINATMNCLSKWLLSGDCVGFNHTVYHVINLPDTIRKQLRKIKWI